MYTFTEGQIKHITNTAKKKTSSQLSDDEFFNPGDAFGGNYDDCYYAE
jgi:hypothetical protein